MCMLLLNTKNFLVFLLFDHYYSSGTQVTINVIAPLDVFLSRLTNIDMKYVINYASFVASEFVPVAVVP